MNGLGSHNSLDWAAAQSGKIPHHLDLVRTYPSCFTSKTVTFDDLVIAHIDVLFRKRSSAR